jgi:uncharacterized membrane protein
LLPGESNDVRVDVTNHGDQPAYWLHLKPFGFQDDVIRIDPPNRLLQGRGRQEWQPARIAKLEPGETKPLYARVTLNLRLPADLVKSDIYPLEIAVVTANNTQVSQTIEVQVRAPYLE